MSVFLRNTRVCGNLFPVSDAIRHRGGRMFSIARVNVHIHRGDNVRIFQPDQFHFRMNIFHCAFTSLKNDFAVKTTAFPVRQMFFPACFCGISALIRVRFHAADPFPVRVPVMRHNVFFSRVRHGFPLYRIIADVRAKSSLCTKMY